MKSRSPIHFLFTSFLVILLLSLFFFRSFDVNGQLSHQDSITKELQSACSTKQYSTVINIVNSLDLEKLSDTLQSEYLNKISFAYAQLEDSMNAYLYYKKYLTAKELMHQENKKKLIGKLQTSYSLEKKDEEIARQKLISNQKEALAFNRKTWIIASVLIGSFIILTMFISLIMFKRKRNIEKKKSEVKRSTYQIEQLRSQLAAVQKERSKIHNHLKRNLIPSLSQFKRFMDDIATPDFIKESVEYKEVYRIISDAEHTLNSIFYFHEDNMHHYHYLSSEIQIFIDKIPKIYNCELTLKVYGHEYAIESHLYQHLLRIVQEVIQNILKHSGASNASIELLYGDKFILMTINDNGKGFKDDIDQEGIGLKNIYERIENLNGSLHIQHEQGTLIKVTIPRYHTDNEKRYA